MSFKDAFTRDKSSEDALNYDDSAFAYFGFTCLTCALLPWAFTYLERRLRLWKRFKSALSSQYGNKEGEAVQCRCTQCEMKDNELKIEDSLWIRFFGSNWDFAQLCIIIGLAYGLYWMATYCLTSIPSVASFDPWNILEISEDASERQIKKAFRTMTLKFHPDKNPNDASAAAKFVLISKAYHTLTNEAAKANFLKFGNPEGDRGLLRVGIGLPHFLIDENSQIFILALFFTFLLVIVPGCFLLYYNYIQQYAPNGLRRETVHMLAGTMSGKMSAQEIIGVISASAEIRALTIPHCEELKILTEGADVDSVAKICQTSTRAYNLLQIHMARQTKLLPKSLRLVTKRILCHAIQVSRAMLDLAFLNSWIPTIQMILIVRKCIIQALEINTAVTACPLPVVQMPYMINEAANQIPERFAPAITLVKTIGPSNPSTFTELALRGIALPKIALPSLSEKQVADLELMVKSVPEIKFEASICVEDEDEICHGDIATCKVRLTRCQLPKGCAQGPVHAPYYPEVKNEEWFIFISDVKTNELYGYKTVSDNSRLVEVDVHVPIIKPGPWHLTAVCLGDSFFGTDRQTDLKFTVLSQQESKRQEIIHPEDVALDAKASLVQQVLGTAPNIEREEDEDDDNLEKK